MLKGSSALKVLGGGRRWATVGRGGGGLLANRLFPEASAWGPFPSLLQGAGGRDWLWRGAQALPRWPGDGQRFRRAHPEGGGPRPRQAQLGRELQSPQMGVELRSFVRDPVGGPPGRSLSRMASCRYWVRGVGVTSGRKASAGPQESLPPSVSHPLSARVGLAPPYKV